MGLYFYISLRKRVVTIMDELDLSIEDEELLFRFAGFVITKLI